MFFLLISTSPIIMLSLLGYVKMLIIFSILQNSQNQIFYQQTVHKYKCTFTQYCKQQYAINAQEMFHNYNLRTVEDL